jgi:Protein of unknown function (DUF3551)
MRHLIVAACALLAFAYAPQPAAAGTWCSAEISGSGDGATNCGFYSWEQCMQTARGSGGFCSRNVWPESVPAATPQRARRQAQKRQR